MEILLVKATPINKRNGEGGGIDVSAGVLISVDTTDRGIEDDVYSVEGGAGSS